MTELAAEEHLAPEARHGGGVAASLRAQGLERHGDAELLVERRVDLTDRAARDEVKDPVSLGDSLARREAVTLGPEGRMRGMAGRSPADRDRAVALRAQPVRCRCHGEGVVVVEEREPVQVAGWQAVGRIRPTSPQRFSWKSHRESLATLARLSR